MKRKSQNEFIQEVKKIYGDKYNYHKIVYINNKSKICIICPSHGEFYKRTDSFLKGSGCQKCFYEDKQQIQKKSPLLFINQVKQKYGDRYDFTFTSYVNAYTPVKIVCPLHGEIIKTPNTILQNNLCFKCKHRDTEDFVKEATIIHHNHYEYTHVKYNSSTEKVLITCKKHGNYYQNPITHMKGHGCPKCKTSKGELKIITILDNLNISYKYQKRITIDERLMVFDFYLPHENIFIEYDGKQHFRDSFFGQFVDIHKKDIDKNNYIISKQLKLLRIHYKDFNILDNIIKNLNIYSKNINYSRREYFNSRHIQIAGTS